MPSSLCPTGRTGKVLGCGCLCFRCFPVDGDLRCSSALWWQDAAGCPPALLPPTQHPSLLTHVHEQPDPSRSRGGRSFDGPQALGVGEEQHYLEGLHGWWGVWGTACTVGCCVHGRPLGGAGGIIHRGACVVGCPRAGGSMHCRGDPGGGEGKGIMHRVGLGRGVRHARWGHPWVAAVSVTPPRPSPAEPSPAGPPPRAVSVRERAQRFTPVGPGPALGPAGAGGSGGRARPGQWQRGPRTAPPGPAQNARGGGGAGQRPATLPVPAGPGPALGLDGMKTYFTIEIKDGRVQHHAPRVVATPGNQRAEVTLGLRGTPIHITTIPSSGGSVCSVSSISSNVTKEPPRKDLSTLFLEAQDPCAHFEGTEEPSGPVAHPPTFSSTRQQSTLHLSRSNSGMEPKGVEQSQVPRLEPELPNGMEKVQVRELERRSKLNIEELSRIEDEDVLDKMLDQTTDFEERRLIRNAMRELRQRKRDQREKERDQRLQETRSQATAGRPDHATETTTTQSTQSADGSARSTVTKTERLIQSSDGSKTSRTTTMESSYVRRSDNGNSTFVQTKSSYSSSSKKTGSIFDREDESASRQSSLAALERRQAEKKKELMKAQSLPKTSTSQARKAMMEKLQKEGGSSPNPAAARTAVQRSSSCGVPNANSIKQMLLDWCRAKTRGYEHVDIQNFSSSWSDGMAFCALVHNFFPEAFDYSQLTPQNRRHNFEVAFSSAEKHADCPQLLDVEDMVRMREPDWKCVYTYIQEFYRCLVQKGLVKTKKS
uniref:Calponin-homology (CH) domain-containing protein n=1 Tax=Calidris pygmaea TaxID=425635 RepID=A0A8C3JR73_9CHAR